MLGLASITEVGWAERAVAHRDELLLEQAHLEKKAAAAAVNLLFRYPDQPALQRPLAELAREELEHFELCLDELERRGIAFGPQLASPYAARLLAIARRGEPGRLLDHLLCCALIEARSFERMRLLGNALAERDPDLSRLYLGLIASEARHHGVYLRLAREIFAAAEVEPRLQTIAAHEAQVQRELPDLPRLHA
jgi:tRNA-(ms[2]io[6]A)-hydroxylase